MGACFACYTSVVSVWKSVWVPIWTWVQKSVQFCTEQSCNWWCLCCNKWLCWIAVILVAVLSFVLVLILEVIVIVTCTLISIWCLLCNVICWIGCLGNSGCYDNCVNQGPCTSPTVEIPFDIPATTGGLKGPSRATRAESGALGRTTSRVPAATDIDSALGWPRLFGKKIALPVAGDPETAARLQRIVDRYSAACGCWEGKVGVLAVLPGLIARHAMLQSFELVDLPFDFAILVLGAAVGKIIGLVHARIALGRSIQQLNTELELRDDRRLPLELRPVHSQEA
jgi:hypothetical protein